MAKEQDLATLRGSGLKTLAENILKAHDIIERTLTLEAQLSKLAARKSQAEKDTAEAIAKYENASQSFAILKAHHDAEISAMQEQRRVEQAGLESDRAVRADTATVEANRIKAGHIKMGEALLSQRDTIASQVADLKRQRAEIQSDIDRALSRVSSAKA